MKIIEYFKKKNWNEVIYIFFTIYVLTLILDYTGIVYANEILIKIMKMIRYICYAAFAVKIVKNWINGDKITIVIMALFVLSIIIAIIANDKSIFFLLLLFLALRKSDFNKLVKITFRIFFFAFFIITMLSLLKIIPDWIFTRGKIIRHSLGFLYPTDAIGIFLTIIIMYFYLRRNKATVYELLVLETINVFLFSYTDGRTSFLLITVILTVLFLKRFNIIKKIFYCKINQKILKISCYCLPVVLFIMINVLTFLYGMGNSLAKEVNTLLSSRIKYTYDAYNEYDITLFGQEIDWKGWGGYGYANLDKIQEFKYNYVDCSYAKIFLNYGIILTTIVLFAYTVLLVKSYKERNYWLLFTICFILIWSFVEQYIISIKKNIFVLAFIPYIEWGTIKMLSYQNIKSMIKKEKGNEKINN